MLEQEASIPAATGDRRVVTILFCDVAGSTSLAEGMDPEAWTEIMNIAFEHLIAAVKRYGGTVAHLMGDAILAFFGAPIAHEDDPQRAGLAGLAISKTKSPFDKSCKAREGSILTCRLVSISASLSLVTLAQRKMLNTHRRHWRDI